MKTVNYDIILVGAGIANNNIYLSGDGAGITRGIMQAAINGSLIADNIRNK